MLIVCRPEISAAEFERLRGHLAKLPYEMRWIRRRNRLLVLLRHASPDDEGLAPLVGDEAVDYVLRDPTEAEIGRLFSRRELLDYSLASTGLIAGVAVLAPLGLYLAAPPGDLSPGGDVFLADARSIEEGQAGELVVGDERYLVIRRHGGRFHALSATCTHSNVCIAEWRADLGQIVCPCHSGVFDIYGNVVSGPPPRPLEYREVIEREGKLYLKRKAQ